MDSKQLNQLIAGGKALCLLNARIIDGVREEPLERGFVRIAGDRITSVGSMREHRASDEDTEGCTIDLEGRTLLPGLIDCHVHLVYDGFTNIEDVDRCRIETGTIAATLNAEKLLRAGYTTVRDVGTIGNVAVAVRDAILQGRIPGPRIVASGRVITPTAGFADNIPSHWHTESGLGIVADGPWDIVKVVRKQIKEGVDNIKMGASGVEVGRHAHTWMTTMCQEEIQVAVGEAHRRGRTVAVHCQSFDSVKFALRAGVDTVEHGTRMDEEAIDLFRKSDSVLVPTLCTLFSVLELGEKLNLLPKQRQEMNVNEKHWLESLRQAREAGIPIATGGDIGNRFPHGTNARELSYFVQNGFSPMAAIKAATATAARALRREKFLGTVTAGKFADLLVVDGDPLADITHLEDAKRLSFIIKGGRLAAGTTRDHVGVGRFPSASIGIEHFEGVF